MAKNSKSQLDYIRDYFIVNSNKDLETTKIKGIIENKYLSETGKRFEDCDRGIRSLYQKGWLIKVRKGCYKYDPNYKSEDKTSHDFPDKIKKQILKRDKYKCVVCKLGKKEGLDLQIDHIRPRDRGGKSTLENGQTIFFDGASNVITITGTLEIEKMAISDTVLYFDVERFLTAQ